MYMFLLSIWKKGALQLNTTDKQAHVVPKL